MSKKKIIIDIIKYFILLVVTLFLSVLIIVTKFLYPYHRILAISFYILFSVFFIFPKLRKIQFEKRIPKRIKEIRYKRIKLGITLIFVIGIYILFTIFPIKNITFATQDINTINETLEIDFLYTKHLIINLDRSVQSLINSGLLDMSYTTASNSDINKIKEEYSLILRHIFELDELIEKYKYFYQINFFRYPRINQKAFLIAYNANIAKYKSILLLAKKTQVNIYPEVLFNENIEPFNQTNSFSSLKSRINSPDEILKINAGRFYIKYIHNSDNLTKEEQYFVDNYIESYDLIYNNLKDSFSISGTNYINIFERNVLASWLPLQETVSRKLSLTHLQKNYSYHIGQEQFDELYQILEPGDIMVHRRRWVATNILMPGFFTHSSIYLGKHDLFFEHFNTVSLELFNISSRDYVQENYPNFYLDYTHNYSGEYQYSTIEGIREMIRILPLEKSADCDYLGVLRPNLSKRDKFLAILDALKNYQKPYDYNFDFLSDDAYVCSELIFKAYMPSRDKKGLVYNLSFNTGRYIFAPNDFVKYHALNQEKGLNQTEFVVFYDFNVTNEKVFKSDEESFKQAYKRPRHDW